jgi:perosamine synthetase
VSNLTPNDFIGALRRVVGHDERVGLHEPDISELEHRYVTECLDSTFVSSVGPFVTRLEEDIATFTGAVAAVAVSNGTSALHVALVLAGVKPGDEVLIPALTFVATANAVSHAGAFVHLIDSDARNIGMSVDALREVLATFDTRGSEVINPATGRRVAAIVPMHALGHPLDIAALCHLAKEFGIPVVEDAAESLGSYVGDQHTGTFGRLGILSFNGNKTITTGGGGMIITMDAELGARAKHLTTTAKVPHRWRFSHDDVAWNYRLPNLNAALGVAQLERLPQFLDEKRAIAAAYERVFAEVEGVQFITEPKGTTSNYWLCSVLLEDDLSSARDEFLDVVNDAGIQIRPVWDLMSDLPMYANAPRGDLSVARNLQSRLLSIPSSPRIARTLPEVPA